MAGLQEVGIVSVPFTKESKGKQSFSGVYDVQRLLTVMPDSIRHPEYFWVPDFTAKIALLCFRLKKVLISNRQQ
jgi:hypothetical protein